MDDEIFQFQPVKSSKSTDSPSSIWQSNYSAIASVNHAIALLDEIREREGISMEDMNAEYKAAYAEAYLIRAYCHFILVNVFSQAYRNDEESKKDIGIPYTTVPEDVVFVDYDRGTVTDTYKKIEEDLEKGLAWVSDRNYSVRKWHFNVNAAHAFAARFYLYKRNYEKVIEHADAVLGTDYSALPAKLMSYVRFDDCVTSSDKAHVWQDPAEPNNIFLLATYSKQSRHSIGYRYACAGLALRDVYYHTGPNSRWTARPAASIGGMYYSKNSDYGFRSAKIGEEFEYTNKVAGTGYPHQVKREFTGCELLLERAEAKLLKQNPDVDGCVQDLIAYENSQMSFSQANLSYRMASGAQWYLTRADIESYYKIVQPVDPQVLKANVIPDWSFTQRQSPDFIIPENLYIYMNCINDFRRFETAWTGRRFFDLKRFGMEFYHVYGKQVETGVEGDTIRVTQFDKRRAIEVPQEVLIAGMESSYEEPKSDPDPN
ncbi:MAG: RagB/SusD family nutrient uptake outer membrane protein, partial [Bacillota bacterium]|nr:RagB/SusD family nutrient uptake outer membrane protein [Bacillota bacterium]